jgi:hypothetical protein
MKRITIFLLISSLVLADTAIDLEATAKAIEQDPSFDKSKVIGAWAAGADAKATLILESDGTFRIIKEKEPITGTWIGGKNQQIVLRFKSSDSDHFIALNLVGGELVDDQVCYKVVYSRK